MPQTLLLGSRLKCGLHMSVARSSFGVRRRPAQIEARGYKCAMLSLSSANEEMSLQICARRTMLAGMGILPFLQETVSPNVASAFGGEIELSDLEWTISKCPPDAYVPTRDPTVCLNVTATANNPLRRKVEAANVFGFVTDAERNSALTVNPTGGTRTVIAPILEPVPTGKSKVKFTLTVFEKSVNKGELTFKGFKAVQSSAEIEARFKPFDPCELSPEDCEEF
ncbi:hypothetical protein CYMTET_41609 [Cymbomonas tetramitiformis]|uniref:Uncharacterized protein n=1 Tax=Cymbomonas tetramitiformis TaxID=36881 RepID=A0AAE0F2G8_9CHLO|nr:hypothetical protein CYMTET_41609 [Cymbomonas tetramitiformis]